MIITGLGHYHPQHKISNLFFESLDIDTTDAWIKERTGIESRYCVLTEEHIKALRTGETSIEQLRASDAFQTIADLSEEPWQIAKQRLNKGLTPELLICGTSVPDYYIPAHSSVIAEKLALPCVNFDAQTACSSFITNLAIAQGMMATQSIKSTAIFNIERYSLTMNYQDRQSCILFGDGATAAIVEDTASHGLKVLDILLDADPQGYDHVKIPTNDYFSQNGARVQKFAVSKTCDISKKILEKNQITINDIRYFIGHQANLRMLQSVCSRLQLNDEQHLFNVNTHGNQGAAGAPSVLSTHWDQYETGDIILVAVVGSGLSWGAALLQKC